MLYLTSPLSICWSRMSSNCSVTRTPNASWLFFNASVIGPFVLRSWLIISNPISSPIALAKEFFLPGIGLPSGPIILLIKNSSEISWAIFGSLRWMSAPDVLPFDPVDVFSLSMLSEDFHTSLLTNLGIKTLSPKELTTFSPFALSMNLPPTDFWTPSGIKVSR